MSDESPEDAVARGARAMKSLRDNLPMLLDGAEMEARLNMARFKNYMAQGFSKEQAMELVMAHIKRGMI